MKIAVVSGASSGMGRELVKMIDQRCPMLDEIWVIARRKERMEKLQFHVRKPLRIFEMDLSKRESLYELQKVMDAKHPHIYVLAASAGFGKYGENMDLKLKDVLGMADVNVRALTGLVHMSLPYMALGSRMLLFSSSAAFLPQPGFGVYAATKAYVLSYARSLHTELKRRRIFVTAVCPGPVKTEFFDHCGSGKALSALKLFFMADPQKVVRHAWRDAMRKKPVSVYGLPMKNVRVLAKTVPHGAILKGMGMFL